MDQRSAGRTAIVHYWLTGWRGGEKVLEELAALYPEADIFTLVCDRRVLPPGLRGRRIVTSRLQKIPGIFRIYRKLLSLMPAALEDLDLRGYGLIISSESGPAKGIIADADAVHLCFVHSPMRYLWNMTHEYQQEIPRLLRGRARKILHRLRIWDFQTAQRVDRFIANSENVARRVRAYWRRDAAVVHPPVDTERFVPAAEPDSGYYLCLGELVGYKRIDLAVAACTRLGLPLTVAGKGPELSRLKKMAGPTVKFTGRCTDDEAVALYQHCRAFLFPGEEDFGITPLEAQACGKPVIAYAAGGALETVVEGETGMFFGVQQVESLEAVLQRFEAGAFVASAERCRAHAADFDRAGFRRRLAEEISSAVAASRHERRLAGEVNPSGS